MIVLFALGPDEEVDPNRTRNHLLLQCGTASGKTLLSQMLSLLIFKWLEDETGKICEQVIAYATKKLHDRDQPKMSMVC
jgi:hypothetical protein